MTTPRQLPVRLFAATPLLVLIACQVPAPKPLTRGAAQPVQYSGEVSTLSWLERAVTKVSRNPGTDTPPVSGAGNLAIEASFYEIDRNTATRLLGLPHAGLMAAPVDPEASRTSLQILARRGQARLIERQRLTCQRGRRAAFMIARQTHYVEGFELVGIPSAMVADPQIGMLQDGILLEVQTRANRQPGDRQTDRQPTEDRRLWFEQHGGVGLDLTMTVARLGPMPVVHVPGRLPQDNPMSVQLPVFSNERLKAGVRIPARRALCFGGLSWSRPGQLLMVFLRQVPVVASRESFATDNSGRAGN